MKRQNRDRFGRFAKNEDSFMDRQISCPCGMIVVMILIFLFIILPLMYILKYFYIKYCVVSSFGSLLYKAAEKYVNTTTIKKEETGL